MLYNVPGNDHLQQFPLGSNIMRFKLIIDSDSLFRPGDTVQGLLEIQGNILKSKPRVAAALKGEFATQTIYPNVADNTQAL